jgi:hypothetical protein
VGVLEGGVLDGGVTVGVDCAHELVPKETASASPANTVTWEAILTVRMTSPPAQFHSRSLERGGFTLHSPGDWAASLHYIDATHLTFGNNEEEYFGNEPNLPRKEAGQGAINSLSNPHSSLQYHRQFVAGLRLNYSGVHAEVGELPCED